MQRNDLTFREETPADFRAVEELTREAFWDVYRPGCDEHFVLHNLRKSLGFVPELSLIAEQGGELVGHIAYSIATLEADDGSEEKLVLFGPVSVRPGLQKKGIGSALILHSLETAREMGFRGVFIYGNPAYYGRFGFGDAVCFAVTTADGKNFPEFMGLELTPGSLSGLSGKLREDNAFYAIPPDELAAYDATFPPREKRFVGTPIN